MRILALVTSLFVLAACDRGGEPAQQAPREIDAKSVTASDELGGFTTAITGVDFWTHPSLAFSSLMLVATDDGLYSYNIEDGTEIDSVSDISPTNMSVAYNGAGATARGMVALYDNNENQFRFYSIDNIDRSFILTPTLMVAPTGVDGLCLGRKADSADLALHVVSDDKLMSYGLNISDAGVSAEETTSIDTPAGLIDCVVDAVDGAVFALRNDGAVFRFLNGGGETPFAVSGATGAVEIGLSLSGFVEGGPTDECCGQIAILDGADGRVHLFDRDDGHAMGVAEVTASFDVEAVTAATAMGVGYGNFGSTYRDGILALATKGDAPVIRLAPWNGVINALGQPLGEPTDPRGLAAQEDDTPALDLNVLDR